MVRVTVEDIATGETESCEVEDDYVLIAVGKRYLAHTQHYPNTGTTVLTIKTAHIERTNP